VAAEVTWQRRLGPVGCTSAATAPLRRGRSPTSTARPRRGAAQLDSAPDRCRRVAASSSQGWPRWAELLPPPLVLLVKQAPHRSVFYAQGDRWFSLSILRLEEGYQLRYLLRQSIVVHHSTNSWALTRNWATGLEPANKY
jgi:hypothetical protein